MKTIVRNLSTATILSPSAVLRTGAAEGLRTSLSCLVHPATLFSIALLVLNDHLFKVVAPSWLTGKVSDFAGLFFFPFLLAATLSVFLGPLRRLTPMAMGRIAIVLTGVWFTLAKATSVGHALTGQLVSAILGHPVSVVLDPTDLIGLVVLWPAWRLWRDEAARAHRDTPVRAGLVALMLAALASVATSPPYQEVVVRFVTTDSDMYVLTRSGPARHVLESGEWRLYRTSDNGRTWSQLASIPSSFEDAMAGPLDTEVVVAHPGNPQMRYRTKKVEERVEYSEDGGNSWRTAWEIPAGRRQFMQRYRGAGVLPGPPIVMGPYDLAFIPDGSGTLVVAMGTEGVLVRDPSGTWSRHVVGMAGPTPFSTPYPSQWLFLLVFPEGLVLVAFTLFVLLLLSIIGWVTILRAERRGRGGRRVMWVLRPVIVAFLVLLILAVGGYVLSSTGMSDDGVLILLILSFLLPIVLLSVLLYTWSRAINLSGDKISARRARMGCLWATVGLFALGGLPFVLWVAGIVPRYTLALGSAVVLGLAVVGVGVAQVYRHSRAANS